MGEKRAKEAYLLQYQSLITKLAIMKVQECKNIFTLKNLIVKIIKNCFFSFWHLTPIWR